MRGYSGLLLIVMALPGAAGCQRTDTTTTTTVSGAQATEARRTIVAWLECEECNAGEREAVTRLGQSAVPTLAATLREGLSPAKRESIRQHLQRAYRDLKEYERTHPESRVAGTEDEYVAGYLDNAEALYRSRAALALGDIGGGDARRALEEAARDTANVRPDVRASISASLARAPR